MRLPRSAPVLLLAVAFFAGCGVPPGLGEEPDAPPGATLVRIRNASAFDLDSVVVDFFRQRVVYGDVPAGGTTAYRQADRAYRYAYIEATVQGQRLVLQPIDYVGETPLGSGRFTYHLTVNLADSTLDVRARRDP
ncbi:MAG TPA: hypothetical protein VF746_31295 [Longimicrobium sp.]|jgi:hypothetical protein